MNPDSGRIQDLAMAISDGAAVDWNALERAASDELERSLLCNLKIIAGIADLGRSGEAADGQAGAPQSVQVSNPGVGETPNVEALLGNREPEELPRRWGHLEMRRKIGAGAFGDVFGAWDTLLDREVALKLLDPARVSTDRREKELASKILEEGRRMARVRHSNVITVYGVELREARIGLWMEFIRGRTLEDLLLEQGPLGAREAANVGLELCGALTAVHRAGLVHRDVKATNVMREEGGRILLMDFGAGLDALQHSGAPLRTVAGTPYYMAPEVVRGESATKQSDLYSLGVLLYHLVTGAYPVEGASLAELRDAHDRRQVQPLREARPDLPEAFVRVVEKALASDPAERFASAAAMQQALAAAQGVEVYEGVPVTTSSKWWGSRRLSIAVPAAAAAVVTLSLAAGLWQWRARRTESGRLVAPSSESTKTSSGTTSIAEPAAGANGNPSGAGATGQPTAQATGAPVPSAQQPYTVEAALYRRGKDGATQQLVPGSRVRSGEGLYLEFQASETLYVYVIDEDERGAAFLLFPLRGFETTNPLPANRTHTLPGERQSESFTWKVTSAGGREHILIVASRDRLTDFEADILAMRQAGSEDEPQYTQLSENAKHHLRGIGGLLKQPPSRAAGSPPPHLFELASNLVSRAEVAQGLWVRRVDLENPGR
jgi:serine/threonine-protein kinase